MPNKSFLNRKLCIATSIGISIGSLMTTASIGIVRFICRDYYSNSTGFNATEFNDSKTDSFNLNENHYDKINNCGLTEQEVYLVYYSGIVIFSGALLGSLLYKITKACSINFSGLRNNMSITAPRVDRLLHVSNINPIYSPINNSNEIENGTKNTPSTLIKDACTYKGFSENPTIAQRTVCA